jgi:hypothetical protein
MKFIALTIAGFALLLAVAIRADEVVMENGDTLNGRVIAMNTNILVLQNANFGAMELPRPKVANIIFGPSKKLAASPTNTVQISQTTAPQTNSDTDLTDMLRGIRGDTNLIQQVQSQVMGSSSPEAVNKFNDLLDGLSTGKIGLNDLRAQAQSAADQLRSLTNGMGPDVGEEASGYLSILDHFLQETAPANAGTNSTGP